MNTIHEPTAWLRGTAARRLRMPDLACVDEVTADGRHVVAYLVPPNSSADRAEWETRCDRCHHICTSGEKFHGGAYKPRPGVLLLLGLCGVCADREGVSHD